MAMTIETLNYVTDRDPLPTKGDCVRITTSGGRTYSIVEREDGRLVVTLVRPFGHTLMVLPRASNVVCLSSED